MRKTKEKAHADTVEGKDNVIDLFLPIIKTVIYIRIRINFIYFFIL